MVVIPGHCVIVFLSNCWSGGYTRWLVRMGVMYPVHTTISKRCFHIAHKVFNSAVKYSPLNRTRYLVYNAVLYISGEAVPFLGDKPLKFLGGKIFMQKYCGGSIIKNTENIVIYFK